VNYSHKKVQQVLEPNGGLFSTISLNVQCIAVSSDLMHAKEGVQ